MVRDRANFKFHQNFKNPLDMLYRMSVNADKLHISPFDGVTELQLMYCFVRENCVILYMADR